MEIDFILLVAAFAGGYLVSRWQCRYYWLINMALRAELIGMRRRVYCDKPDKKSKTPPYKRKLSKRLPRMPWWAKAFISFLKRFFPGAVSYNQFHPGTVNAWAKKLFLTSTYISLLKKWAIKQKIRKDRNKARKTGRPSTPEYVVDIILSIKKENQGYSPGMIARILKTQLDISIHKKTVQAILKKNGYPPNPPGKIHPVVERFNLTLQTELLSLITAINLTHINRLLQQYRKYYNTARPHMTNNDFPPDKPEKMPVIVPFSDRKLGNVKSVSWVNGFHHSYSWAA